MESAPELSPEMAALPNGAHICRLCGSAVVKMNAWRHAQRTHLTTKPHVCLLCAYMTRDNSRLLQHIRKVHKREPNDGDTHISLVPEMRSEIADKVEECFGRPFEELPAASLSCVGCGAWVAREAAKDHVALTHLALPFLFACAFCDFKSSEWRGHRTAQHVKRVHGVARARAPKDFVTKRPEYEDVMDKMFFEMFGQTPGSHWE